MHIQRIHPLDEVPSNTGPLESEAPFDRPVAPDEDEDERSRRSPSVDSIDIADEQESLEVEKLLCSLEERTITEHMLDHLNEQKRATETLAARMADTTQGQPKPNQPANRNMVGPKLPRGVAGLGREGTWVVADPWEPFLVPSTDQLPTVRESGEEQRVESGSPPNNVIQEDHIPNSNPQIGNPRPRGLTPLPSFVSGNPAW